MKLSFIKIDKTIQLICSGIICLTIFSCSKSDDTPQSPVQIMLTSNATFGNILTDKDGRTLYYFANDASGESTCAGGCAMAWPAFTVDTLTADKIGTGLNFSNFGTVASTSGGTQVTYRGWPLYYYSPGGNGTDGLEAAGATDGENVGGIWFVVKPDYTIMLANAQLIGHDGKHYTSAYVEGDGKTIYFTDGNGITLYTFKNDKFNKNNFTKADFSNNGIWPVYETDQAIVPSVLDKSLFSSIDVFGKKQLTYKGWPLYYFGQDEMEMGYNKGISFPVPGIWPVPVKDAATAPE